MLKIGAARLNGWSSLFCILNNTFAKPREISSLWTSNTLRALHIKAV
jgi:hypothetical protein